MRWNGRWRCVRGNAGNSTLRVRRHWRRRTRHRLGPRACPRLRSGVEHPFLKVKRIFGYAKVRYRGLAKNTERLALLFGLGNLLTAEGQLTG